MSHLLNFISRVCMSAVFIAYGIPKLLHPENVANLGASKRLMAVVASGAPAPTWFGYLIGGIEVLGGILLLYRRTALAGTLFSAFVIANVVIYNFCYDVPVKLGLRDQPIAESELTPFPPHS